MKLQYVSDLHLEFYNDFFKFPITGDYLVLLGDIGKPRTLQYQGFIKWASENYKKVFLLAGNHEYYHSDVTFETMHEYIKNFASKFPNVIFMNNTMYEEGEYRFLGTTLWSYVPPENEFVVKTGLNDYYQIKKYRKTPNGTIIKKPITVYETNQLHHQAVEWLKKEIEDAKTLGKKVVIFTHHAPLKSNTSAPEYETTDNGLSSGFATDLSELMEPHVKVWLYGHTHWCCDFVFDSTCRISSNAKGYPDEIIKGFNSVKIIEI